MTWLSLIFYKNAIFMN